MKIVKLSFNYDFPVFRQTSNYSQIWGDYKFIIDDNLKECDFWVVYTSYRLKEEKVKCNPNNIIFLPGECFTSGPKYFQSFLNQFGAIVTVQRELKHRNIIYAHNANPWFIGKSFDELNSSKTPEKTKSISVICSNRTVTEGHRKRLKFVEELNHYFGNRLDVFGKGIRGFEDKWEVLKDYKYSIVIENDFCEDWVTEKYFDCLYSNTLSFYYGCPNLEDIVNKDTFIRIDIDNVTEAIKIIEESILNEAYNKRKDILAEEKIKSLHRDHFFPFIVSILNNFDPNLKKKNVKLLENKDCSYNGKIKKVVRKISLKINYLIHVVQNKESH